MDRFPSFLLFPFCGLFLLPLFFAPFAHFLLHLLPGSFPQQFLPISFFIPSFLSALAAPQQFGTSLPVLPPFSLFLSLALGWFTAAAPPVGALFDPWQGLSDQLENKVRPLWSKIMVRKCFRIGEFSKILEKLRVEMLAHFRQLFRAAFWALPKARLERLTVT